MNREKLYNKYQKKFNVKNAVSGRRSKRKFSDIIANKTFDKTYDVFLKNTNLDKNKIEQIALNELRTEFVGIWGTIQFLIWMYRIIKMIKFILEDIDK